MTLAATRSPTPGGPERRWPTTAAVSVSVSCPTTVPRRLGGGTYADTWQVRHLEDPWSTCPSASCRPRDGRPVGRLSCDVRTFRLADSTDGLFLAAQWLRRAAIASPPAASPGNHRAACASSTFCVAAVTPSTNSSSSRPASGVAILQRGYGGSAVKFMGRAHGRWQHSSVFKHQVCGRSTTSAEVATFNGKSWRQLKAPAMEMDGTGRLVRRELLRGAQAGRRDESDRERRGRCFNGRSRTYRQLLPGFTDRAGWSTTCRARRRGTFCVATARSGPDVQLRRLR